jgi:hypothetical protein
LVVLDVVNQEWHELDGKVCGGGCKFSKPKWPRRLSEGKDAVGVLLHEKQPILLEQCMY